MAVRGESAGVVCAPFYRGVDNFLGLGGLISKDKRAAIRLKGEGDMPPPARSAEAKIFFKG